MAGERGAHAAKPAQFALMRYPLTGEILLPAVLAWFTSEPAQYARWLYLFATGQGYRLPPRERARLDAVTSAYDADGRLRPLLELGRGVDPRADRMLEDW